jgi:hypothetical protein
MRVRFVGADNKVHDAPADLDHYSIRAGNYTICADWINDRLDTLAAYCASIKAGLSLPGTVFMTCYASPGGHGFGTHWDCQASFILQLEGKKRWRYSKAPVVPWPPAVVSNPRIVPEIKDRYPWMQVEFPDDVAESNFAEQVLSPGDVLFLPAGTWHTAAALEYSVALTMACVPMTAADFVDDLVRGGLSGSEKWRKSIPPVPMNRARSNYLPSAVHSFFNARLGELRTYVNTLHAEDLYEAWTHHLASFDTPFQVEKEFPSVGEVVLTDQFTVNRDFPLRWIPHPGEGSHTLYFQDRSIVLADETLPLLKVLLRRSSLSARSAAKLLGADVEWSQVKTLLEALLQTGVLQRATPVAIANPRAKQPSPKAAGARGPRRPSD